MRRLEPEESKGIKGLRFALRKNPWNLRTSESRRLRDLEQRNARLYRAYLLKETIVETYRRYYPLIQEAYIGLGYPDGYFNDRAVEVIDHLLATPVPDGPVRLERPHVLYEFADPELEALSSGQKLLLRMGSDQATRLQQALAELRSRIATP